MKKKEPQISTNKKAPYETLMQVRGNELKTGDFIYSSAENEPLFVVVKLTNTFLTISKVDPKADCKYVAYKKNHYRFTAPTATVWYKVIPTPKAEVKVTGVATIKEWCKGYDLDQLLGEITVTACDELADNFEVNDPNHRLNKALSGWYAVVDTDGINAYFSTEKEALRHRLDLINRILND